MARDLEVKITDYTPDFVKLMQNAKGGAVLNHTANALSFIIQAYQKVWVSFARGSMRVPGAKLIQSRGPYARSIQVDDSKPYEKTVFTDYEAHKYIEQGHGEIDLKPGLLAGSSAREGKAGPYNIIAFRHGVPSSQEQGAGATTRRDVMPISIFNLMLEKTRQADAEKKAGLSAKEGMSKQLTSGPKPQNRSYKWGGRLDNKMARGQRSQLHSKSTWATGKYAGMVRMQQRTGAAKRSSYITFRVVSHASPPNSWIVPPQAPIPIRQATVDFVAQQFNVEDILRQAIEKDIS